MAKQAQSNLNGSNNPNHALGERVGAARAGRLERRLRASREATQLIFAADSPTSLIQAACRNLSENLEYPHAWIALLDAQNRAQGIASEGLMGSKAEVLQARIAAGECASFIDHVVSAKGL